MSVWKSAQTARPEWCWEGSAEVGAAAEVGGCDEDGMGSSENIGGAEEAWAVDEGNKEDDEAVGVDVGCGAVDGDGSGIGEEKADVSGWAAGEVALEARVAEVLVELEAVVSEGGEDAVGADVGIGAAGVSAGPKIVVIVVLVWYSTPGIGENEEEDGTREERLFSVRVAGALLCSACVDVSEGPKTVTMVVVVSYAMPGTEENEELAAGMEDSLPVNEEACGLLSAGAAAELDKRKVEAATVLL
ncbi:hypothetical protein H2199_000642 [Coniosporium tulheliwenetii]|uniref:Uncharacterized protein n=1 Tax=Coniosporium tulheliwenetii TaxID=3383036 RepID=A0ACC2ZMF4_9PEZI|nr:hypothetical protein H2199_000642 [Cladosporium sp. JES 115]